MNSSTFANSTAVILVTDLSDYYGWIAIVVIISIIIGAYDFLTREEEE